MEEMKALILIVPLMIQTAFAKCEKIKSNPDALEKAWRSEIMKDIKRYGRYSRYSVQSFKEFGNERVVRMVFLERECKEFKYSVSIDIECKPQASIKSLASCFREN